jgi:hypothetical protein
LKREFTSFNFFMTSLAERYQIMLLVCLVVIAVEVSHRENVVNMQRSINGIAFVLIAAGLACPIISLANICRDTLPIWPVINWFASLPEPVVATSVYLRHSFVAALLRTAQIFIRGWHCKYFAALLADFINWGDPLRIINSLPRNRQAFFVAIPRTISGLSIARFFREVFARLKRLPAVIAVDGRRTLRGAICGSAFGAAKLNGVYSAWVDKSFFVAIQTVYSNLRFWGWHIVPPVVRSPEYARALVRKPALSAGNYAAQAHLYFTTFMPLRERTNSEFSKACKCPSADATNYRQCPEIVSSTNGINNTYGGVTPDETRINE